MPFAATATAPTGSAGARVAILVISVSHQYFTRLAEAGSQTPIGPQA